MGRFLTPEDTTGTQYRESRGKHDWILNGELHQNYPYIIEWYEDDSIDWKRKTNDIPKVSVRRWCERNLDGDVYVINQMNSEYREGSSWGSGYQVHAHWTEFHFEFETDAMAFKLEWM